MSRLAIAAVGMALLVPSALAQDMPNFAVLDARYAPAVLRQCSRPTPEPLTGTWRPTDADIKALEARLPQLQALESTQCCSPQARVKDPGTYYRQYVGVVIGNRKVIYINAFRAPIIDATNRKDRWRYEPVLVCDGGDGFWGAIYDPETKEFSELAFNGVA